MATTVGTKHLSYIVLSYAACPLLNSAITFSFIGDAE